MGRRVQSSTGGWKVERGVWLIERDDSAEWKENKNNSI